MPPSSDSARLGSAARSHAFWLIQGLGLVVGVLLARRILAEVGSLADLRLFADYEAWWWRSAAVLAVGSWVVGWRVRRAAVWAWPTALMLSVGAVLGLVRYREFWTLLVGLLLGGYVRGQVRRLAAAPDRSELADGGAARLVSMVGWLAVGAVGLVLISAVTVEEGAATGLTEFRVGVEALAASAVVHLAAGWWLWRGGRWARWIAYACCGVGAALVVAVVAVGRWRTGVGDFLRSISEGRGLWPGATVLVVVFLLATWAWILSAPRPAPGIERVAESSPGDASVSGRLRRAFSGVGVAVAIVAVVGGGAGALVAPRFLGPTAVRIESALSSVFAVTFSPDGRTLAVGGSRSREAAVELSDVAGRRRIDTLAVARRDVGGEYFTSVAFSPDGRLLAAAGLRAFAVWDVATRTRIDWPHAEVHGPCCVVFSADNRTLAVGENRCGQTGGTACAFVSAVSLWDVAGRRKVAQLPSDDSTLQGLAFSPNATRLVTEAYLGGGDTNVRLWDVTTRSPIGNPIDRATLGEFSPDGQLLAVGGQRAELYDVANGQRAGAPLHDAPTGPMVFRPDGRLVAALHSDDPYQLRSYVQLWDVTTRRRVGDPIPNSSSPRLNSLAFTPDGRTLAHSDAHSTVRLWDVGRYSST